MAFTSSCKGAVQGRPGVLILMYATQVDLDGGGPSLSVRCLRARRGAAISGVSLQSTELPREVAGCWGVHLQDHDLPPDPPRRTAGLLPWLLAAVLAVAIGLLLWRPTEPKSAPAEHNTITLNKPPIEMPTR